MRSSFTSRYGRERVGADLAAERDVALLARDLRELVGALLAHAFGQARGEDLHRACLVLGLRSLVLARHDDAGGQVGDAHRGVGDVHVLAAGARRPVGVDAQVLLVDVGLFGGLEGGHAVERRERGLTARVGVER